jgi:hypothetical protein
MKKLALIAALVGAVGLAGYQMASAHMDGHGPGFGGGYGSCGNYGPDGPAYSDEDNANLTKFRDETVGLRKDLAVKRSELGAINRQDNPDAKRVAELTGEIFDLQTKLEQIAEKYELNKGGRGYGMRGNGRHPGMMGPGGRGYGRHMMDW